MGTQGVNPAQQDGERAVFQCEVCGTRRVATAIRYDDLGYAVCPVCTYSHGP
ncbi:MULTISPECIES: hypothetical protein [Salinibaculum]|uniref:hypothetical protein n=1 Tax=Salinibaculum TaxID=2732368 RepID=UPI0030CE03D9